MIRKLTPKQERFIEEYMIDFNATQAAIRAGYNKKSAARVAHGLVNKSLVQEAIKARRDRLEKHTVVTKERVVKMMLELYEVSSQKVPLLDRDGNQVFDDRGRPVYKPVDAQAFGKAVDMLGKHTGAFEADNKRELSGGISVIWQADGEETK